MVNRQLKNLSSKSSLDKIQRTIASHRIEWKFITEKATWNGGYWERLVTSLKRTQSGKSLARQYRFMRNRSNDKRQTSNIYHSSIPMTSAPTIEEHKLSLNRKWKKQQQIVLKIWKRWRSEYSTTFVNRAKWLTKRQEPKEGDILLVKEDNLKRDNWPQQ
ncbi:hypothetical protein T4D_10383 [Trichinella pseudospiralis]|uniref:DUF5641 domain-containing protein n=1 Tax=Trichinella pseudospiralis TaxID=6337 RepID=A0A0V1F6G1_TRIPS|nr:hypothetical protein T4D_10383 [Trichinella pseudospiralis]